MLALAWLGVAGRGSAEADMKTSEANAGNDFPISLFLGGASIGAARSVETEEGTGTFRFEGLDFIARVFFAERVGPGGPENTPLVDLSVSHRNGQRIMRAHQATVRHFSAGTGDLEVTTPLAPSREGVD
jgi:hypothetical protein